MSSKSSPTWQAGVTVGETVGIAVGVGTAVAVGTGVGVTWPGVGVGAGVGVGSPVKKTFLTSSTILPDMPYPETE